MAEVDYSISGLTNWLGLRERRQRLVTPPPPLPLLVVFDSLGFQSWLGFRGQMLRLFPLPLLLPLIRAGL